MTENQGSSEVASKKDRRNFRDVICFQLQQSWPTLTGFEVDDLEINHSWPHSLVNNFPLTSRPHQARPPRRYISGTLKSFLSTGQGPSWAGDPTETEVTHDQFVEYILILRNQYHLYSFKSDEIIMNVFNRENTFKTTILYCIRTNWRSLKLLRLIGYYHYLVFGPLFIDWGTVASLKKQLWCIGCNRSHVCVSV